MSLFYMGTDNIDLEVREARGEDGLVLDWRGDCPTGFRPKANVAPGDVLGGVLLQMRPVVAILYLFRRGFLTWVNKLMERTYD